MRAILLVAEREFRAYTAGPSFWIALLVAPLLMAAAVFLPAAGAAPPTRVAAVQADDPALKAAAVHALADAAALEGARLVLAAPGAPGATLVTVKAGPAGPVADVVGPLGAAARAALTRDLAQAQRDRMLREAGLRPEIELDLGRVQARLKDRAVPSAGRPPAGAARFALMAVLWMTLVGSLGMLLQAVVRERANRTLESLLASVRPSSLVAGKLLGVGAVSAVVLLAWLGGAVVLARVPGLEGLARMAGAELAPLALARAAVIYLFAYAMYGAAMVAVGVAARDLPAAQNLSRPVFAVLLLVFFGAMAAAGGGGERFAGLAWLPPLTPFLLLLFPDSLTFGAQAATLGLTALTTVALAGWASRRLIVRG